MKLAYLSNSRFPSERAHAAQITHMCQAFAKNGVDVTLFVNRRAGGTAEAIGAYFNITPQFAVMRMGQRRLHEWWKGMFYLGEFWFALVFLLRHTPNQYDIIYSRSEWIVAALSFFVSPEKLVYESHEAKLNTAARRIVRRQIKSICISAGIKQFYLDAGVPAAQLLVADDGIDESFFAPAETKAVARVRWGIDPDAFVVAYIGGFDQWKGIETFFNAAALDTGPRQWLAIGGKPAEVERLKKIYPDVVFLGPRPYHELRDNQQVADVLVIPNTAKTKLSSQYTSPLKLFAHMASGVPLVVSDIPSLTSIVSKDEVTLVTPDDPAALVAGVTSVQIQYERKRQQATKLQGKAKQYTWTNRAKTIITFVTS